MEFRLPETNDKNEIISYIQEHYACGENSLSASLGLTSMKYEDWVKKIHDNITKGDDTWGKSYTYLVFDNKKLIGLLNVRHGVSGKLLEEYGHIGYGVRPSQRRKGYATKMLQYGLERCKQLGLNEVIVGCYKDNIGSAKTIIKNGGKLMREVDNYTDINEYWKINLIDQFYEIKL